MSKRHKARLAAFHILFESNLRDVSPIDILEKNGVGNISEAQYAHLLISGISSHNSQITSAIQSYAQDWEIDRMPKVDFTIAQIATFEILYSNKIPGVEVDGAVAISEALLLAEEFSTPTSVNFLNGVLGRILVVKEALI